MIDYLLESGNSNNKDFANILIQNNSRINKSVLALNPNTSIEILDRLSYDDHNWVRRAVARNLNTTDETLYRLSNIADDYDVIEDDNYDDYDVRNAALEALSRRREEI